MPWYWIVLIISIIVGPFESLYVVNKAAKRRRRQREQAEAKEKENGGTRS